MAFDTRCGTLLLEGVGAPGAAATPRAGARSLTLRTLPRLRAVAPQPTTAARKSSVPVNWPVARQAEGTRLGERPLARALAHPLEGAAASPNPPHPAPRRRAITPSMLRAGVAQRPVHMPEVPRLPGKDPLTAPSAIHQRGLHPRRPPSPQSTMPWPVLAVMHRIHRPRLPMLKTEPIPARLRHEVTLTAWLSALPIGVHSGRRHRGEKDHGGGSARLSGLKTACSCGCGPHRQKLGRMWPW